MVSRNYYSLYLDISHFSSNLVLFYIVFNTLIRRYATPSPAQRKKGVSFIIQQSLVAEKGYSGVNAYSQLPARNYHQVE